MKNLYPFFFILFLFSCSLEYKEGENPSENSKIPSSIFYNIEKNQVKNGYKNISFTASKAEVWDEEGETHLEQIDFKEYDSLGESLNWGKADKAVIFEDNDVTIEGHIKGYSLSQKTTLEADSLKWSDQDHILSSEDSVFLYKEDGTSLRGEGFSSNFYTNKTIFSANASGTIVVGDP